MARPGPQPPQGRHHPPGIPRHNQRLKRLGRHAPRPCKCAPPDGATELGRPRRTPAIANGRPATKNQQPMHSDAPRTVPKPTPPPSELSWHVATTGRKSPRPRPESPPAGLAKPQRLQMAGRLPKIDSPGPANKGTTLNRQSRPRKQRDHPPTQPGQSPN